MMSSGPRGRCCSLTTRGAAKKGWGWVAMKPISYKALHIISSSSFLPKHFTLFHVEFQFLVKEWWWCRQSKDYGKTLSRFPEWKGKMKWPCVISEYNSLLQWAHFFRCAQEKSVINWIWLLLKRLPQSCTYFSFLGMVRQVRLVRGTWTHGIATAFTRVIHVTQAHFALGVRAQKDFGANFEWAFLGCKLVFIY
jgi:hypothetical protein